MTYRSTYYCTYKPDTNIVYGTYWRTRVGKAGYELRGGASVRSLKTTMNFESVLAVTGMIELTENPGSRCAVPGVGCTAKSFPNSVPVIPSPSRLKPLQPEVGEPGEPIL